MKKLIGARSRPAAVGARGSKPASSRPQFEKPSKDDLAQLAQLDIHSTVASILASGKDKHLSVGKTQSHS
jgi:hypothetical protein